MPTITWARCKEAPRHGKLPQKFAPNRSEDTAPMRELLKEDNQFLRDEEVQGLRFERVKQLISESPGPKCFDAKADSELQCDACDKGLGACLMQSGQPGGYASRALTSEEINRTIHILKKNSSPLYLGLSGSNSMSKKDLARFKQIISPSGESSRIVKSVLQSVYNVWCYNYRSMTLELLIRTYPWCTWQIPSVEHLSNNFPMKKEEEMQRKTLRVSTWSSTFSVWDDMEWHSHSYWIRPGHGRIKDHYNRRLAR